MVVRAWRGTRAGFISLMRAAQASGRHSQRGLAGRILGATPPWLVSVLVHSSLMLLVGLVAVEAKRTVDEEMAIDVAPLVDEADETYAETLGEQLDKPMPGTTPDDMEAGLDATYSMSDLPNVDDPLAAPPPSLEMTSEGSGFFSNIEAPSIGMALEGRQEGRKQALMDSYGGTKTTQESVTLALAWLSRQQGRDGLWSLAGPYDDGSNSENQLAATAMAMLAFLGDGHTHMDDGPYRRNVQRAVTAMIKLQGPDGQLIPAEGRTQQLYTHAQCTIALCELYGITQDSQIRDAAEQAVAYCVKIQSPQGGWRYFPFEEADTSVTGWFVMALQSARMAKLEVPADTLDRVGTFLDSVSSHNGSRYCYLPGRAETPPMTAEALLCRQYLGWARNDPRLVEGVAYVSQHPVDWKHKNVYYWYYATQVMHHMGGDSWVEWNRVMRQVIPENQIRSGRLRGSWHPRDDAWGGTAGRLYMTCLCTYMLEVYYRHLPLYGTEIAAAETDSPSESDKPAK